jgi:hypothetical protein
MRGEAVAVRRSLVVLVALVLFAMPGEVGAQRIEIDAPASVLCRSEITIEARNLPSEANVALLLASSPGDYATLATNTASVDGTIRFAVSPFPIGVDCEKDSIELRIAIFDERGVLQSILEPPVRIAVAATVGPEPPETGQGSLEGHSQTDQLIVMSALLAIVAGMLLLMRHVTSR